MIIIYEISFFLFILDMFLTGYYVSNYKKYAPEKEYNKMERNPLLVFLFKHLGIWMGLFIGTFIITMIWYILIVYITKYILIFMMPIYSWAIINHFINMQKLNDLIYYKKEVKNNE